MKHEAIDRPSVGLINNHVAYFISTLRSAHEIHTLLLLTHICPRLRARAGVGGEQQYMDSKGRYEISHVIIYTYQDYKYEHEAL